jgi:hypothetical protein
MMHGRGVEHNDPARTAHDDQSQARDEADSRARLLRLGAADLDPRPWEPAGMPPSAVDLVRFFQWWSGRDDDGDPHDDPDAARAALALLPAARAELDQLETALLFTARGAGLTWAQMAEALGMNSPQACQQRLDRLLARQARDDGGRTG